MDTSLALAEAALEQGDYGQCIDELTKLLERHPLTSEKGGRIRMLLITAWMGKGEDQKAISLCRQLTRSKDSEIRQESRQLLSVLESPSLERPKNWSIQLPNIDLTTSTGNNFNQLKINTKKKKKEPSPPTGPTRALSKGFSSMVLIILAILTLLLSGCVQIKNEIFLPAPDQIQFNWAIQSNTMKLLPWQIEFASSLRRNMPNIDITSESRGQQKIRTPSMRSKDANITLQKLFSTAIESTGLDIVPPELSLREKNWLIGVQQNVKLNIDLKELPIIPGLEFFIIINNPSNNLELNSIPIQAEQDKDGVTWKIQQGKTNTLNFYQWKWNKLGIGIIIVLTLLFLTLILQSIRVNMGFGFPELPP